MITKVLELIQQINEETTYHAFFDFSGHVEQVSVHIKKPNSNNRLYNKSCYLKDERLNDGRWGDIPLTEIIYELEKFLEEEQHATA